MTPYEAIQQKHKLPFELYQYQQDTVNTLAPIPRSGHYLDIGTGKTITATAAALYKMLHGVEHAIVLAPPVLLNNWARTILSVSDTSCQIYRGSPKERTAMQLVAQFIVMSYQIFKKDWDRLWRAFAGKRLVLIADEAQAVKNVGSQNYKMLRDFVAEHDLMLLTGTPLSNPGDAYAYIKLIAPEIYRNQHQFENIHVKERDFFDRVTEWRNLDLLAGNLKVNSVRILKEDVLKDLPPITYTPLYYDLDPKHLKLYQRLCEEQIAKLPNGDKIDLTQVTALFHALQQVPCNAEHFSGGELRSSAMDLLDEVMEELDGRKLLVFTNYVMTNRRLLEHGKKYGVKAIFSETKDKEASLQAFIHDPGCRLLVLQVQAGGAGIDGLQDVANDVLFLEMPQVPYHFHQACGRLHRAGQRKNVNVRVAIAERTLQVRLWENLQDKDSLVNRVVRGPQDLRDALSGK